MALLTAQTVGRAGVQLAFEAADAAGDTFLPTSDRAKLLVRNDDASPHTVTIVTPGTVAGLAVDDTEVTVAAGEIEAVPLYKQLYADPSDGLIDITYDDVTSVDVAVITD